MRRKRCKSCGILTYNYQSINGSLVHCYDGCYSTTGYDRRTPDGSPWWEWKSKGKRNYVRRQRRRYKKESDRWQDREQFESWLNQVLDTVK